MTEETNKSPAVEAPKEEKRKAREEYICPFCSQVFKTRAGLWKHLKKCEEKPDEEPPEDYDEPSGISLFSDDENEEEEEDGYQCPACGLVRKTIFFRCPKCGAELEWD